MTEFRCTKCNKLLAKIEGDVPTLKGSVNITIKCPHNYRDGNGKNVQCKTFNSIVI